LDNHDAQSPWSNVGNFLLDLIPPTGSITINGGDEYTTIRDVDLTIVAEDEITEIAEMIICNTNTFEDCTWEEYVTEKSWSLTSGDGLKRVYARFKDDAGNESVIYNSSITLDTTAPVGTLRINNGAQSTDRREVTLNITGSDVTSGVHQMMICNVQSFSGCSWENFRISRSWTLTDGEGTKTVYLRIRDNAGLISSVYNASITLAFPVAEPTQTTTTTTTTPAVQQPREETVVQEEVEEEEIDEEVIEEDIILPGDRPRVQRYLLRVLDKNLKPVKGAHVRLETGAEGYTNENGEVEFVEIDGGRQKATITYGDITIEKEINVLGETDENVEENLIVEEVEVTEEGISWDIIIYVLFGLVTVSVVGYILLSKKR
jgi:hypothetical protein